MTTQRMVDIHDANDAARNDYWIVDWRNAPRVPNPLIARKCVCVQQLSNDKERSEPVGALCLQLRHPGNLKRDKNKCKGDWADAVWSHQACQLDDILVVLLACSLQLHHRILPQHIHIVSADKSILKSLNIDYYTSPPAFEAQLFARFDGEPQSLTGPLHIEARDLVSMCQHMNFMRPGFHALKLGKQIPNLTSSESTWPPGRPQHLAVQEPSLPHSIDVQAPSPRRPVEPPRPHPIIAALVPSVKMTVEEAKAALRTHLIEATPENWEKAFLGFLDRADLATDTDLKIKHVASMVSNVQTMEQAIALVSRRGTLFAYLPEALRASIPVKVAAVAGSRSLREIRASIKASQLKLLLKKVPESGEAHKILEMTIRILESTQDDALESARDLKLEFASHPDWPSYFDGLE